MKKKKGFTLIELLLVVIVVVILAGTIMVSGEESIISAEANNIINNMRILKSAVLEWAADYGDYIQHTAIKSAGRPRQPYMITYPYPSVMGGDVENMYDGGKAKLHIQNVFLTDYPKGRATIMKYIQKSYPKPEMIPSVNEVVGDKPYTKEKGYAIVDGDGCHSNVGGKWTCGLKKWYVVYKFVQNGDNKLRKKIEDKAEEFGLLKDEENPYTKDSYWAYMEILDFDKYYGNKK